MGGTVKQLHDFTNDTISTSIESAGNSESNGICESKLTEIDGGERVVLRSGGATQKYHSFV